MWKNRGPALVWGDLIRDPDAEVVHECEIFDMLNPDTYQHNLYMHGKALSGRAYRYPDGSIGMDNEEYGIRVLFCPYCGHNLQTDAPVTQFSPIVSK